MFYPNSNFNEILLFTFNLVVNYPSRFRIETHEFSGRKLPFAPLVQHLHSISHFQQFLFRLAARHPNVKLRAETSELRHGCRPSETIAIRRDFGKPVEGPSQRGFQKSCPSTGECPKSCSNCRNAAPILRRVAFGYIRTRLRNDSLSSKGLAVPCRIPLQYSCRIPSLGPDLSIICFIFFTL